MPGDTNLDHLGNPTWAYYSARSFTTIGRYGQYQAESFRHSLKEETEKLRAATTTTGTGAGAAKYTTTPSTAATSTTTEHNGAGIFVPSLKLVLD